MIESVRLFLEHRFAGSGIRIALPLAVTMVMALLWVSTGCFPKKEPPNGTPISTLPNRVGTDLLSMLDRGQNDTVINQLLEADIAKVVSRSTQASLTTTEAKFSELSTAAKASLQSELIEMVGKLKQLARECIKKGDDAMANGDEASAKRFYRLVSNLGSELSSSGRMIQLQQLGKFMTESVKDKP